MRHISYARRTNEEKVVAKEDRKEFFRKTKERILGKYVDYNESARSEIFNPETDHPEDAPEITKEGYSFAKKFYLIC